MADLFDRFESNYGQAGGGQEWKQHRPQVSSNPFDDVDFTAMQSVSPTHASMHGNHIWPLLCVYVEVLVSVAH